MNHKDLDVWKYAIDLTLEIYAITSTFPSEEKFGITNQMRRASVSIPSNIAEGCARYSDKETIKFVNVAIGSLAELETQIILSAKLGYIENSESVMSKINEVGKLLFGLKNYLTKK